MGREPVGIGLQFREGDVMRKAEKERLQERLALCRELPIIRDRLFRCGMVLTSAAIKQAIDAAGFEAAKQMPSAKDHAP